MNEKLKTLILMGCRHAGNYDPDDVLPRIEEELTPKEYEVANKFLTWVHTNNKRFGHNIGEVFKEYKNEI